jgi:hypothetical protein
MASTLRQAPSRPPSKGNQEDLADCIPARNGSLAAVGIRRSRRNSPWCERSCTRWSKFHIVCSDERILGAGHYVQHVNVAALQKWAEEREAALSSLVVGRIRYARATAGVPSSRTTRTAFTG